MFGGFTLAILLGRAIALTIGFTLHEWAHAWTAYRLGDKTPLFQGRLTLDPRAHIEPIGIILALLIGFGWAKPVPVNPRAFYPNERRGMMIVALAGPVTNLLLALGFGMVLRILVEIGILGIEGFFTQVIETIVLFNIVLFLFNLIPLSPLDGWKILLGLVPSDRAYEIQRYERESTFALMLILMIGTLNPAFNLIGVVFNPLINFLFRLSVGYYFF